MDSQAGAVWWFEVEKLLWISMTGNWILIFLRRSLCFLLFYRVFCTPFPSFLDGERLIFLRRPRWKREGRGRGEIGAFVGGRRGEKRRLLLITRFLDPPFLLVCSFYEVVVLIKCRRSNFLQFTCGIRWCRCDKIFLLSLYLTFWLLCGSSSLWFAKWKIKRKLIKCMKGNFVFTKYLATWSK